MLGENIKIKLYIPMNTYLSIFSELSIIKLYSTLNLEKVGFYLMDVSNKYFTKT